MKYNLICMLSLDASNIPLVVPLLSPREAMGMKSYLKKLLKWDEPLGLTIISAWALSCFPKIAPPPRARKLITVLGWYHMAMFICLMVSSATNVFVAEDFFSECLESVHFLVTGIHLFTKYITMRVKEKEFVELFGHIQRVWGIYEPRHHIFLSKTVKSANNVTVLIFLGIGTRMVVNILSAVLNNMLEPDKIHFPLQIWVPPVVRDSFVAGVIAQTMAFQSPLLMICATTSFLNSISCHVEAIGLALALDIQKRKDWDEDEATKFYKNHQELIRIVLKVNELMAGNWGFELICSSLQLTLPAYRTLRAMKLGEIEVFHHGFILIINFLVIYLIFHSGNRILTMGEEIRDRFYDTNWYNLPMSERKNFLFALVRATYPIEYKYKTIHFDLPGFTVLVNTVFSYMAILQTLDGVGDDGIL